MCDANISVTSPGCLRMVQAGVKSPWIDGVYAAQQSHLQKRSIAGPSGLPPITIASPG